MKNCSTYTLMVQQNTRGRDCFTANLFTINITWSFRNRTGSSAESCRRQIVWVRRGANTCNIHSYNKNQLDALISQIYFWNKILHVSDSSSAHHQEFFTVHTAMVYVIQICWQLASRIRTEFRPDPARKLMMDRGIVRNM